MAELNVELLLGPGLSSLVESALAARVAAVLGRIVGPVRRALSPLVVAAIIDSTEAEALRTGVLHGEMGLVDPAASVLAVAAAVASAVEVTSGPDWLTCGILRADLSDALSASGASFLSEKAKKVDWLRWLLEDGDGVIISDYAFYPGNYTLKNSRTGRGFMNIPKDGPYSRFVPGWRVPAQYAGTPADNWLTRCLGPAAPLMAQAILAEFESALAREG